MADRWFYWQRTILGKWSPVIADTAPAKRTASGSAGPTVVGVQKLEAQHDGWTLNDCAKNWPHPATGIGQ